RARQPRGGRADDGSRLRGARLSESRVEVRLAQPPLAPRGAPAGVRLRGPLPPAHDLERPKSGYRLVFDDRGRVAAPRPAGPLIGSVSGARPRARSTDPRTESRNEEPDELRRRPLARGGA